MTLDLRVNNDDLRAMLTIAGIRVEVIHTNMGTMFELYCEGTDGFAYMVELPLGATEELWRATIVKLIEDANVTAR